MRTHGLVVTSVVVLALGGACGDDESSSEDAGVDAGGGTGGSKAGSGGGGGRASMAGRAGRGGASGSAGSTAGGGGSPGGSTQPITIRFKAKIGNADVQCGSSVPGQGTTQASVEPRDFRFFVSEVKLVAQDDSEVAVELETRSPWQNEDVALLDFEDGTGLCGSGDAMTNAEITGRAPRGDYKAIVFTNGVPADVNHGDPAVLPPPLRQSPMTWGWLLGHRFVVVEVASMIDDAEVAGGLLHIGSTGCSNTALEDGGVDFDAPPAITCSKSNRNRVRLDDYEVGTSVIVADAAELFEDLDLQQDNGCHAGGTSCPTMFEAAGLNFADGSALSTQSFFRLE